MLSLELRDRIALYISGDISLHELEDWLVPNLPALIQDPVSAEADLVAAIELCLAEYSAGFRDEDYVRNYLREALLKHNTISFTYPSNQVTIVTGASAREHSQEYSTGPAKDFVNNQKILKL